jgi:hypothetical protein
MDSVKKYFIATLFNKSIDYEQLLSLFYVGFLSLYELNCKDTKMIRDI